MNQTKNKRSKSKLPKVEAKFRILYTLKIRHGWGDNLE